MQSGSGLSHLLSISVVLLTRIIGAARWPTISSSAVLRFPRHASVSKMTLFKMVALGMAAMELMVLAGCSCVFEWAF